MIKCLHPIDKLASLLDEEGVEYVKRPLFDGFQIILPWCEADVICHSCCYGGKNGLLEIQGPALFKQEEPYKDDVLGRLTVEDVFERIKAANTNEHLDKESQEAVLLNFVEGPKKAKKRFDDFEESERKHDEKIKKLKSAIEELCSLNPLFNEAYNKLNEPAFFMAMNSARERELQKTILELMYD